MSDERKQNIPIGSTIRITGPSSENHLNHERSFGAGWHNDMSKFIGKTAKVIRYNETYNSYELDIDNQDYWWMEMWIEIIKDSEENERTEENTSESGSIEQTTK